MWPVRALGVALMVLGGVAAFVIGWVSLFIASTACENVDGKCDNSDLVPALAGLVVAVAVVALGAFLVFRQRAR